MSLLIDSLRRFVPRGLRNLVRRPRASWDRALAKRKLPGWNGPKRENRSWLEREVPSNVCVRMEKLR